MCGCRLHREMQLFGLPQRHAHHALAGERPLPRRSWLALAGASLATIWAAPWLVAAKLSGRTVSYDYIASGALRGSQTTGTAPDGSLDVRFAFNDRGRGPSLRSVIRLDRRGFVSTLRTSGYNYLKVPVGERFTAHGGTVSWKNAVERETLPAAEPRFYPSIDGTPEELAILARAALREPNGLIPLWPSGTATVRKVHAIDVRSGVLTRRVALYELLGIDFSPLQLWLDEDGTLFVFGSEWGAVVRDGWTPVLPHLLAAQNARMAELGRQYAKTLPQHASTAIAITGVALFDADAGALTPNATVLIHGETVAAAGGSEVTVPSDARRIDGTGKTLLPGLWNSHMHVAAEFGPRLLAEGVTTIRDPGNAPEYITTTKRRFDSGQLVGPRILIAGLIDGKGRYTAPIGRTASTPDEAIAQVRAWKKAGAVQIKVYSSVAPALVPVIVREAHALGMRVSGHIPAGMIAQDAVNAGFDEIQHVNFLFLNFMPDVKDRTQTPVRLTAPALRAGTIDLQSSEVSAFVALLKAREIVSDPTLGIFVDSCMTRPGDVASTGFGEIAARLPIQVRRSLTTSGLPGGGDTDQKYRASADAYRRMVALLHRHGIPIVAGTDDLLPGFDLVRELELYSEAGIPNADVLRTATIVPARVMRLGGSLGSLRPGKLADAILVRGDPLENISRLRNIETTIKGGVMYDSRALYATAGISGPPAG